MTEKEKLETLTNVLSMYKWLLSILWDEDDENS